MKRHPFQVTGRTAVLYGVVATLWIILSDRCLAALLSESPLVSALHTGKALAFVGAASVWIYLAWQAKLRHGEREAAARRQVEERLRESEERLRLAIETAPMGTWDLNLLTGRVYWSANMWALFGLTPDPENLCFELFRNALHPEDRERVLLAVATACQTNTPYTTEFRVVYPDGRIRWSLSNGRCIADASGKVVRMVGVDLDITERKEAEAVLRASEQRFRTLSRAINDAVWDCDLSTNRVIWSESLTTMFGYPVAPETEGPAWWRERIHPEDRERMAAMLASAMKGKNPTWSTDYRFRRADGSYADVLSRGQVLHDDHGRPVWMMGALMDISQRKQTEEALRQSESRLKLALTAARMGVWEWDVRSNRVFWSDECLELVGLAPFEGTFLDTFDGFAQIIHPDDVGRVSQAIQQAVATHTIFQADFRIVHPDGAVRWLSDLGLTEYDEAGAPLRMVGSVIDIHQRKQSELALEHQRRRMEGIVNSAMDGIITINEEQRIEVYNPAAERIFGYPAAEILGHSIARLFPVQDVEAYQEHIRRFGQTAETARAVDRLGPVRGRRSNGEEFPLEAALSHIQLDGRKLYTVTCRDVTERIRAETLIRDSQERFGQLAEHIREVFWITDITKHEMLYISPAYEEIWGRTCESLYKSPRDWLEAIHPEDRDWLQKAIGTKQATGEYDEIYRVLRPDGALRWIHDRAFPIRDTDGKVTQVAGVAEDITERRLLQEQLLQSQKLEAIGLLAGGVAHDFNNLLTVIKGNASLMLAPNVSPEQNLEGAYEIVKAAERAASLTRQLLLFSRKQALQLTEVNLNDTVGDMIKLLQRILGEDIVLSSAYAPKLPLISADVGMIEQVLLNLAVNSRDAMPRGGRLLLCTELETLDARQAQQTPDAAPGVYVCLTVSDNGCGIAKEHLAHIFEPFFTTKEVGKGTGLGLATVYGIVKQHHGRITVYSETNRGTTFRICFPALSGDAKQSVVKATSPESPHGHQTILVVEDEPAVRRLVASLLTQTGYTVLQAASGIEALTVWQAHASRIDLLLTDLVMPDGINGTELAERLQAERPTLRVLYTSGYSPNQSADDTRMQEGVNFLQKPYQPKKLIGMVRDQLQSG